MTTEATIRLLVAEDHFLAGYALVAYLGGVPGLQVVGKAETGHEAVRLYRQHKPDVVLMDLMLPEMDGLAAIGAIVSADAAARTLVLSNLDSEEDIHRAVCAGARGYLRKDVSGDVLVQAIKRVHGGGRFFPPEVVEKIADRSTHSELTARELDVLRQLALGRTNQQIADALGLRESTVRIYVSNVIVKLGAKRRTEAVALATKRGLVRMP